MDGRGGGCLIARYDDVSKVNRIMLRYRPIAPKPPASGSGSGSSPDSSEATARIGGRGKRRCYARKRKAPPGPGSGSCRNNEKKKKKNEAVTLPLLPVTPDRRSSPERESLAGNRTVQASNRTSWLSFGGCDGNYYDTNNLADGGNRQAEAAWWVGSCVTVESVGDTWQCADGASVFPGRTDEESRINLGRDTSPCLISDGFERVTWTNDAYVEMVCGSSRASAGVVVWLVARERAPAAASFFTCRVRVEYGGKEDSARRRSETVPCDVWRMDGGGYAWRLDVDAALRLGR